MLRHMKNSFAGMTCTDTVKVSYRATIMTLWAERKCKNVEHCNIEKYKTMTFRKYT